jgi:hypothetical protein
MHKEKLSNLESKLKEEKFNVFKSGLLRRKLKQNDENHRMIRLCSAAYVTYLLHGAKCYLKN